MEWEPNFWPIGAASGSAGVSTMIGMISFLGAWGQESGFEDRIHMELFHFSALMMVESAASHLETVTRSALLAAKSKIV